jgi:hypothetical protein
MDPRPFLENIPAFNTRKLCVLVTGNLSNPAPFAGYAHRKEIIDFFESKKTGEFDLYGSGWEQKKYQCYRGIISESGDRRLNKIRILQQYKFDICYENAQLNGWLSERIFESFAAGCIPIYWGAQSIEKYIPKQCFIDRTTFKDNQELYLFLITMTEQMYQEYIHNIRNFLESDAAKQLSTPHYIANIRTVLNLAS